MIKQGKCKGCNAKIKWITTKNGKSIPVDAYELTVLPGEGNTIIVKPDGEVVKGKLAMKGTSGVVTGYISHFATCPKANEFRKKGE